MLQNLEKIHSKHEKIFFIIQQDLLLEISDNLSKICGAYFI